MNRIYIIQSGEKYEGGYIDKVYSSFDNAQEYAYNNIKNGDWVTIEEWEIDGNLINRYYVKK